MMNFKCKMESMVSAYMDGALPPSGNRRFEAHLKECPVCRKSLETLTALDGVLKTVPDISPSPEFEKRFYEKLNREHARESWFSRLRPFFAGPKAWGAAAACVLLAIAAWTLIKPAPVHMTAEDLVIAKHFDILQHYEIIENLELLENWEKVHPEETEL